MNASRFILLALLLAAPALAASGGAPITLSHSGYLISADDEPIDDPTASLTFRLFATANATTPEWSATCPVPIAAGYYGVQLGAGAGACAGDGLDTADVPPGQARFLEIELAGVRFTPRLAIHPAPHVVLTSDAERLGGLLPSAYVKATDAIAASTIGGQSLAQLDARFARFGATQTGNLAIAGSITAGSLSGDGALVTNVDAAKVAGQSLAQIDARYPVLTPTAPPTPQSGHVAVSGSIAAGTLAGSGAGLTNVDAAKLGGKALAEVVGYVRNDSSTGSCAGNAGIVRWSGSAFEGCDGTSWRRIAYALAISGVSPASGAAGGGTAMTINGSGFASGSEVRVAGVLATSVTVVSATQITAVTPAYSGAPGAVDVRVTSATGELSSLSNAFTYVADGSQAQYALASCKAIRDASGLVRGSTAYWIDPDGAAATIAPFQAFCDASFDGGGWTLIESLTRDHAIQTAAATGAAWYADVPRNEASPGLSGDYRLSYARLNALRTVSTELAATTDDNGFTKDFFKSADARNNLYVLGDDSGTPNYKNVTYDVLNIRGTTFTNRVTRTWMKPSANGWPSGGHQHIDDPGIGCSSCDYFGYNGTRDTLFSGHVAATSKTHHWLR